MLTTAVRVPLNLFPIQIPRRNLITGGISALKSHRIFLPRACHCVPESMPLKLDQLWQIPFRIKNLLHRVKLSV
jgi:hypothetical protein